MTRKVLLLGNDEFSDLVRAGGGWIIATAPADELDAALTRIDPPDLIVADLRGLAPEEAVQAIAALPDRPIPTLVTIHADLIDLAAAVLDDALLLVDPEPIEAAAALAVALANESSGVRERSAGIDLQQLSEEAGRIARALADLAAGGAAPEQPLAPDAPTAPVIGAIAIRSILRKRRLRGRFFAAEIFADPAWDILLDLYAARLEGAQVAVSSLCIAACVPPTTALRWIRALTAQGLLVRIADPDDGRRVFIALSDGAADRMAAYFLACA